MKREGDPGWVRAVAWLSVATAPVFLLLGVVHSEAPWACAGLALGAFGWIVLRKRATADGCA